MPSMQAFGIDIDSIAVDHPFAQAFDRVQELSNNRYKNPFWKAARFARTPGEVNTSLLSPWGLLHER